MSSVRYSYNRVCFTAILASPKDFGEKLIPPGYNFDSSIEGKALWELDRLSYGEFDETKDAESDRIENELAKRVADAALPLMRQLAPTPNPEPRTLHDLLYPLTFTLQVFTEDNKLACREIEHDDVGLPEQHPPVPEATLRAMGLDLEAPDSELPVVEASQVLLVRCIQNLVWLVNVDGVDMVCKASLDIFEHAIGHELETYLNIRRAGVELKLPQLKGRSASPSMMIIS